MIYYRSDQNLLTLILSYKNADFAHKDIEYVREKNCIFILMSRRILNPIIVKFFNKYSFFGNNPRFVGFIIRKN